MQDDPTPREDARRPPRRGDLLVATPQLTDPNFRQTVVLLVRHDADEGALGVVLNRPTRLPLAELWRQVYDEPVIAPDVVFQGGPVAGPLLTLHSHAEFGHDRVAEGVYFTAERDAVAALLQTTGGRRRFFVAYAGWGAEQLEGEIAEGSWWLLPATAADVFADPERVYKRVNSRLTREDVLGPLQVREAPDDPTLN